MTSTSDLDEPPSQRLTEEVLPIEGEEGDPTSFATSPLVSLYVGPKQHKFMIHKYLLIKRSPYLEKCLKPSSVEGQTLQIKLEEDHSAGFEVFVTWIYNGVVEAMEGVHDTLLELKKQATIDAWVLVDKRCMREFQNKILEAFQIHHDEWNAVAGDLLYICQLELGDSKLVIYLFDQVADALVHNWGTRFGDKYIARA